MLGAKTSAISNFSFGLIFNLIKCQRSASCIYIKAMKAISRLSKLRTFLTSAWLYKPTSDESRLFSLFLSADVFAKQPIFSLVIWDVNHCSKEIARLYNFLWRKLNLLDKSIGEPCFIEPI